MSRNLGSIAEAFVELRVDLQQLSAQFAEGRKITERSSRQMASAIGQVDSKLGRAAATARSFGAAIAAVGAGAAVAGLINMARQAVNAADSLAETAQAIGINVEKLQELRFVAERVGVSTEQLDGALGKFSKGIGQAAAGTGELKKITDQYNIALRNSDGSIRSVSDLFADFADLIKGTRDQSEQLRITTTAFGRGAIEVNNILQLGSQGLTDYADKARALGAILSQDTINSAAAAQDAIDDLSAAFTGAGNAALTHAIPGIKRLTEFLAGPGLSIIKQAGIGFEKLFATAEEKSLETVRYELAQTTDAIAEVEAQLNKLRGAFSKGLGANTGLEVKLVEKKLDELTKIRGELQARIDFLQGPPKGSAAAASVAAATPPPFTPIVSPRTPRSVATSSPAAPGIPAFRPRQFSQGSEQFGPFAPAAPGVPMLKPLAEAEAQQDALNRKVELFGRLAAEATSNFASGIADAVVESKGLGETLAAVGKQILKTLIEISLQRAIGGAIAGFFPGFAAASSAGAGATTAFARGGIVTGPTIFPMARGMGLMGEAGPEAVMPLTRIGGKLGVQATGGGGDVTVNVVNQTPAKVEVGETTGPDGRRVVSMLIRQELGDMQRSGALETMTGARPRPRRLRG